ncbi:hypothetical protein BDZ45DRAFT_806296 [Acephala macrosclerotiorum]|nr:hypothetical protein BDZ45DRAFT_806296 [Acephala macrosclerotiorum]
MVFAEKAFSMWGSGEPFSAKLPLLSKSVAGTALPKQRITTRKKRSQRPEIGSVFPISFITALLPSPHRNLNSNFTSARPFFLVTIAFLNLNIKWAHHKWALFYCLVSTIGSLCYGYDTIYYTAIRGMGAFVRDFGAAYRRNILTTIFLSVTASLIYGRKAIRQRTHLLVCTFGILISPIVVGGLGTTHRDGPFSQSIGITIVAFSYVNIVCSDFSNGTLFYTTTSEIAVGRNRSKIAASAIEAFFFTVWLMVFASPYLYFSANLGPMLGFFYADTTLFTLAYVWFFCRGDYRTTQVFIDAEVELEKEEEKSAVYQEAETKVLSG